MNRVRKTHAVLHWTKHTDYCQHPTVRKQQSPKASSHWHPGFLVKQEHEQPPCSKAWLPHFAGTTFKHSPEVHVPAPPAVTSQRLLEVINRDFITAAWKDMSKMGMLETYTQQANVCSSLYPCRHLLPPEQLCHLTELLLDLSAGCCSQHHINDRSTFPSFYSLHHPQQKVWGLPQTPKIKHTHLLSQRNIPVCYHSLDALWVA